MSRIKVRRLMVTGCLARGTHRICATGPVIDVDDSGYRCRLIDGSVGTYAVLSPGAGILLVSIVPDAEACETAIADAIKCGREKVRRDARQVEEFAAIWQAQNEG